MLDDVTVEPKRLADVLQLPPGNNGSSASLSLRVEKPLPFPWSRAVFGVQICKSLTATGELSVSPHPPREQD